MKKIITQILPVLSLILSGTTFIYAQNEKNPGTECETSVDQPLMTKDPIVTAGQTKWQPNPMSLLYDNGPLINQAGQGAGGADVSALHDGLISYGFSQRVAGNFRVADNFSVPSGETWTIDSIIFYGYQTGSTTTSTFSEARLAVRNASPLVNSAPSAIVWGDTTSNVLDASYWSGIYRTNSTLYTDAQRPIMKNVITPAALQLATGDYWLDWAAVGTLTSGPWVPPITDPAQTITGDGIQFVGGSLSWAPLIDTAQAGTTDNAAQGLPFTIYGSINNGINEVYANNNIVVYPNPMHSSATVSISDKIQKSSLGFSFVVYDIIGNLIRKTDGITTNKFAIKKENINAGVYIYEVLNGNEVIKRGKLSVQND